MKNHRLLLMYCLIFLSAPALFAYVNLTPAQVHNRLVRADTVQLLDVREVSEYVAGHIAEPAGQLPLTPANMPWSSGILNAEYDRLPRDIPIIVNCKAGGRSAAASAFLESVGFDSIYNMTSGFSGWSYEQRSGGYGDHSGKWVSLTDSEPDTIACQDCGVSRIIFPASALPGTDSLYVELHNAFATHTERFSLNPDDVDGLFRITVLDPYGVPMFAGDSLLLSDSLTMELALATSGNFLPSNEVKMLMYVPGIGWQQAPFQMHAAVSTWRGAVLRRWYAMVRSNQTAVAVHEITVPSDDVFAYPNPFNGAINIVAPQKASVSIYDIRGRFVERISSHAWLPKSDVPSGVYLVRVDHAGQQTIRRILYLK